MKKIYKPIVASFFLYFCISTVGYSQSDYTVGVFYFPGFADDHIHPWSQIEPYPERIPVTELMTNNVYTSSSQTTVDTELSIMSDYGISFVLMDWYWTPTYYKYYKKNLHEDGIYNYLKSPNSSLVKFALMWDNVTTPIKSLDELDGFIDYLAKTYFTDQRHYKIDNKVIFYIFDISYLKSSAEAMGVQPVFIINLLKNRLKENYGVDLEVWVGGVSSKYWVDYIKGINVDGVFQYNMHSPATVSLHNGSPVNASHTYAELSFSYSNTWSFIKNSLDSLPYLVPVTSGWSKTPWGGTLSDPLHDASVSTVDEFEKHLLDAKSFVDENPILTNNQIAVCCWNEFGEGSYIAPTNANGYKYLEKIKTVFSLISKVDSGTSTDSGTGTDSGSSTDSGTSTDNTASPSDSSSSSGGSSLSDSSSSSGGSSSSDSSSSSSGSSLSGSSSSSSGSSLSGSSSSSGGSSSSGSSSSSGGNSTSGSSPSTSNSSTPVIATYGFSAGGITSDGSNENTSVAGDENKDKDNRQEINNINMSMIDNASSSFKAVLIFQNSSNVLISSTTSGQILVDDQKSSGDEVAVNSNEPILLQVSDIQSTKIYYNGELLSQSDLEKITDENGILLQ